MNLYEKKHNEIINENQIQIKVIELEKLSNNPEIVLKDLFNFLDLEWDKKFLNKYMTNKNIIQTVSNLQVRQKISKHDLSYLDKYIPLLKDYKIENLI